MFPRIPEERPSRKLNLHPKFKSPSRRLGWMLYWDVVGCWYTSEKADDAMLFEISWLNQSSCDDVGVS